MGFYVDLEMPENCPMCPFAHYDDMFNTFRGCDITRGKRWAVTNDKDYAKSSTRPDWCPLIEVPEPHGDLIDRQKLLEDNKHLEYPTDGKYRSDRAWAVGFNAGAKHANEHVYYSKTIIPASEEG